MNDKEETLFELFKKEHYEKHKNKKWKAKNHSILKLNFNSGIGIGYDIQCMYCKKEKDITDYDCW